MRAICLAILAAPLIALVAQAQAAAPPRGFDELPAFMDSVMDVEIREYGVPGIVVVVVHEGRVLFAKGYGVADRTTRRRVLAEHTVFRLGSISKPLTAIAALQLVEAGRLDLNAPVSRYVGNLVRGRYAERVRVRDLITHTSGLDVRLNGTVVKNLAEQTRLREYLVRDLPPVVHEPGMLVRYSNHGYTLLGHVIEV
ncbi:MAG TPA: serine hydrolase domain-containing protein, partial [Longimicrobium sp.]